MGIFIRIKVAYIAKWDLLVIVLVLIFLTRKTSSEFFEFDVMCRKRILYFDKMLCWKINFLDKMPKCNECHKLINLPFWFLGFWWYENIMNNEWVMSETETLIRLSEKGKNSFTQQFQPPYF